MKDLRDKGSIHDQARTFYQLLRIKKNEVRKIKEEKQRVRL